MTFIGGLRSDRLTAPWVIEGAMNGPADARTHLLIQIYFCKGEARTWN